MSNFTIVLIAWYIEFEIKVAVFSNSRLLLVDIQVGSHSVLQIIRFALIKSSKSTSPLALWRPSCLKSCDWHYRYCQLWFQCFFLFRLKSDDAIQIVLLWKWSLRIISQIDSVVLRWCHITTRWCQPDFGVLAPSWLPLYSHHFVKKSERCEDDSLLENLCWFYSHG